MQKNKDIMKTNKNISVYETFCRLMTEENLYIDPTLTFATVCRWLGASPAALDHRLEQELGYSGEALIAELRSRQAFRLREQYGIVR